MERRIPYWLYKTGYEQFPAHDYDKKTKTIIVDIPKMNRRIWPKGWEKRCNHYHTPKGSTVYFYNTGIAQNYYVEGPYRPYNQRTKTIPAGYDAFEKMLKVVEEFENE